MIRSAAFWTGVAAGGLVTWWVARRRSQLIAATPYFPRSLTRRGRRGGSWPGQSQAYNR